MNELTIRSGGFSALRDRRPVMYPLQRRFLVLGLLGGLITSCLFLSPLIGFSLLVLAIVVGALWRRDEPPVLSFCIGLQWLGVFAGYCYEQVAGFYPGFPEIGYLEQAVFLSLMGFLVLAAGLRMGIRSFPRMFVRAEQELKSRSSPYDIRRLFWCVVALFTLNWFVEIHPMGILFSAAQLIYRFLEFRNVLLFMLFLEIFQQRTRYRYGVLALLYVLIPSFASVMSASVGIFIPPTVALLSQWRPWSGSIAERRRSARIVWGVAGLATVLLVMGLAWQGSVKARWRSAVVSRTVVGSPTEKVTAFASIAQEGISDLDFRKSVESLTERLSSGVAFFSHVLVQVPDIMPYENGHLTLRALKHVFTPRILFPEKPNLGADSWLIWQYAGLSAAGEEQGTSVGLGYMPEFYIDFGVPGMFVAIFIYGIIFGLAYRILLLFSPSYNLFCSAVAIISLLHFSTYEGEIAKDLGGLLQAFAVFAVLLRFVCPALQNKILKKAPTRH